MARIAKQRSACRNIAHHFFLEIETDHEIADGAAYPKFPIKWSDTTRWDQAFHKSTGTWQQFSSLLEDVMDQRTSILCLEQHMDKWMGDCVAWAHTTMTGMMRDALVQPEWNDGPTKATQSAMLAKGKAGGDARDLGSSKGITTEDKYPHL